MFNCSPCVVIWNSDSESTTDQCISTIFSVFSPNRMAQCVFELKNYHSAMSHSLHWSSISIDKCILRSAGANQAATLAMCLRMHLQPRLFIVRALFVFTVFASGNLCHRNKSSAFLLYAIVTGLCVRRLFKRAGNLLAFLFFVFFSPKMSISTWSFLHIYCMYVRQGAFCTRSQYMHSLWSSWPLFGEQCENGFQKATNNAKHRDMSAIPSERIECVFECTPWPFPMRWHIICLVSRIQCDKYRSSAVANYAVRNA